MDLKQLRALLVIAETGSVTRAADILHIVQPAISRQIKLLEEELGVSLFDRERHGMVLTAAGRQFAERTRNALRELDKGKEEVSPRMQQVYGSVVVGFLPSGAELMVSRLMGRMLQNHPHIHLRSYITYLSDLERNLEQGQLDVALLYMKDCSAARIPNDPVLDESLYLVGPPEAGLDMSQPLPLAGLNDVSLVLPALPHGVRALIERECAAAGVGLSVAAETTSMAVQKSLVKQGVGLSILPGVMIAEELSRGLLTACPIAAINLKRTLYLARATTKAATAATLKVIDELRECVRQCVAEGRWPGAVLRDAAARP